MGNKSTNKNTNRITSTKIRSEIKAFTTSRDALIAHAHNIEMMIINFAAPVGAGDDCQGNGNVTTMGELMVELPNSWQGQMNRHLREYTPIRVKIDQKAGTAVVGYDQKYLNLKKKFSGKELEAERLKWWNVAEAAATPFNVLTMEDESKPEFTFEQAVKIAEQGANRIQKMIDEERVPADELEAMLAYKNRLLGVRYDDISTNLRAQKEAAQEAKVEARDSADDDAGVKGE